MENYENYSQEDLQELSEKVDNEVNRRKAIEIGKAMSEHLDGTYGLEGIDIAKG